MGIFGFFRRKDVFDEDARRARLLRNGRIAEGTIFDINTDEAGAVTHVFFRYSISGVDYEASQALDGAQAQRPADYVPGARVVIRYDPRQPGNSVVV